MITLLDDDARQSIDAAVGGGPWYDVLGRGPGARGPAYTRLDDAQLRRAVDLAASVERDGDPRLRELDAASLRARGKPPKAPRSRSS